jgi:hypothetical protein
MRGITQGSAGSRILSSQPQNLPIPGTKSSVLLLLPSGITLDTILKLVKRVNLVSIVFAPGLTMLIVRLFGIGS